MIKYAIVLLLVLDVILLIAVAILAGVFLSSRKTQKNGSEKGKTKTGGKKTPHRGKKTPEPPNPPVPTEPPKPSGRPQEMNGYSIWFVDERDDKKKWNRFFSRGMIIGRASDCDLVLSDMSVSRLHCRLEATPEGVYLWNNLGAKNKTKIDGQEVVGSQLLLPGQTISMGRERIRVENIRRVKNGQMSDLEWDDENEKPLIIDTEPITDEMSRIFNYTEDDAEIIESLQELSGAKSEDEIPL